MVYRVTGRRVRGNVQEKSAKQHKKLQKLIIHQIRGLSSMSHRLNHMTSTLIGFLLQEKPKFFYPTGETQSE